jgi:MoxR-like ATPase
MLISNFKKSMPFLIDSGVPAFLWSPHGSGKSQSVKQFTEDNGYLFVDLRLGTQEVGDLLGLADFLVDEKTGKKIATQFFTPDWLHQTIEYCHKNPESKAIIFLDEFNRARRDVLQASFQLVLDKQLHTVKLPTNTYVLAAGNPNTSDYIVTDVSDKALMDRFCHIKLAPSVDEWIKNAEKREYASEVVDFIRDQKTLLTGETEDFSLDFVKPSRRSWEMVSKLIKAKLPTEQAQEVISGLVGVPAAAAFIEHTKNSDKPLTAEDVLNSYKKHTAKVKEYCKDSGSRFDLVKATGEKLVEHLNKMNEAKTTVTKKQADNLVAFCDDVPDDFLFSFLKDIYRFNSCRDSIDKATHLIDRIKNVREKAKIAVQ